MARRGSFGAGINPFGSSQPSGLSAYSIGSSLASYDAYVAEVGWQNGTVSNDDYLASLTKVLNATTEGTNQRVSAQNKLDDAKYQIGRQAAQEKGLDDLIAFDQRTLATMRSDNYRYQSIQNSLESEQATRRSRDYGKLVDQVNAGTLSTQGLLDWVNETRAGLTKDAPDFENWASTSADLTNTIQNQKDSKVYQDYQFGRIDGKSFLEYITTRRDSFDPSSEKYADWNRKLEDATKNVNDAEENKQDTAFFDLYNEGKKSDADYLAYIKARLDGLPADDPQYETWRHRYTTAAFSIAEDQLRYAVKNGSRPVSDLVSFYKSYATTLNQGSSEYRSTMDKIESLKGYSSGGGGGGSSKGGNPAAGGLGDALISGKYTLDSILPSLSVNPYATAANQKATQAYFDLNYNSLNDAHNNGDQVWLFHDPKRPGATVQGRNPDGSLMVDASGKPVMVSGSAYLPVTDEALANLNIIDAQYNYEMAKIALSDGDATAFAKYTKSGDDASQRVRSVGGSAYMKLAQSQYDAGMIALDQAKQTGDLAAAYNTIQSIRETLKSELANPYLTDDQRTKVQGQLSDLLQNNGVMVFDPLTGVQTGGAVIPSLSSFNPVVTNPVTGEKTGGEMVTPQVDPHWNFVIGVNSTGQADNKWVYTPLDPESWRQGGDDGKKYVQIKTEYKGQSVQGNVKVDSAAISPQVTVMAGGQQLSIVAPSAAESITFVDSNGNTVHAWTLDHGATWMSGKFAAPPQIQLQGKFTLSKDGKSLVDSNGVVAAQVGQNGSTWQVSPDWVKANPGSLNWYGIGPGMQVTADQGASTNGQWYRNMRGTGEGQPSAQGPSGQVPGIGAPGAWYTYVTADISGLAGSSNIVDFTYSRLKTETQAGIDRGFIPTGAQLPVSKPQTWDSTPGASDYGKLMGYIPSDQQIVAAQQSAAVQNSIYLSAPGSALKNAGDYGVERGYIPNAFQNSPTPPMLPKPPIPGAMSAPVYDSNTHTLPSIPAGGDWALPVVKPVELTTPTKPIVSLPTKTYDTTSGTIKTTTPTAPVSKGQHWDANLHQLVSD